MPSQTQVLWRRSTLCAYLGAAATLCIALFGCSGDSPVAPHSAAPKSTYEVSAIACAYAHGDSAVVCAEYAHSDARTLAAAIAALHGHPAPAFVPGVLRPTGTIRTSVGTRDVYFGQQGIDVFVGLSNFTYSGGVFSFPATIQNLSTEPLGSADGLSPSPDSIIVFFSQQPVVTSGTGTVTVENAKTGAFTASNQLYYQYPGLLPSNGTSESVTWTFGVPNTVQGFGFDVFVAAQVPDTSSGALAIPAHAFDSLAVGEAHSCAIRPGNHEYCWGFNAYGEMGIGESAPVTTPRGVLGNLSIAGVTSGTEFSCGLATGGAYCWGDNASGELGDGTLIDRGEPVLTAPPTGSFSKLAAGTDFSCGLANGTAYCWGDNYTGQLGDGTTNPHSTPQPVAGSPQFTPGSLTAGAFHACALTAGGNAYCWGANADGELGTGNYASSSAPVAVSGGVVFGSLVAGTNFTCGLDGGGNAWCWGANVFGSLGTGSAGASANAPQQVIGGHQFSRLTAGAYHACGIVAGSGAAYCWGSNISGQLGIGSVNDNATPQLVSGALAFTAIGAGFGHTCALQSTGATYCWGDNSSGQIGDGTFTQRTVPTAVSLP